MKALTERQAEVLAAIRRYIEANGFPPTQRELCVLLGCRSTNAVNEHLVALEKKGAIERRPLASRGIRVLAERTRG